MKKILVVGLLFFILVLPRNVYAANEIADINLVPSVHCLSSNPCTKSYNATPSTTSPLGTSESPSVAQTSPTTQPSVSISTTPTTAISPCPNTNTISIQSAKKSESTKGEKVHQKSTNGFLSQLIQFLLELLELILQKLGIQLPSLPGEIANPCPSPSPSVNVGPSTAPSPASKISQSQPTNTQVKPTVAAVSTTPVISSSCTNPIWSSSDAEGTWTASNGFLVQNDAWNGDHGPQTIYVCSYNSFYAVSNQTDTGGEVKTYPDVGENFNDAKTVGSFSTITSSFGEAIQQMGEWDAAYDIWTNNWGNELMIWNDTHNHPEIPPSGSQAVTIDGIAYHVWRNGSNYIAFMRDTKVQSGSVNILNVFQWLEQQGWMKTSDTLTSIEYGVEVSVSESSPNVQGIQTFPITNFSITAN